jgi:hypothetical protein
MDLEEIGLITQVLGLVLVAASLVFVGFQMRQTHAIERGNAQRDLLNQTRDWWVLGVQDQDWFDTISAGLHDFHSLDRFQQARFNAWGFNLLHIIEGVFFQNRSALFVSTSHEGYMLAALAILNTKGGRMWWAEASKVVNTEFSAYLSKRLAADAASLPAWNDLFPHFRHPSDHTANAEQKSPV